MNTDQWPILTCAVRISVILTGIGIHTVLRAAADRIRGKKIYWREGQ